MEPDNELSPEGEQNELSLDQLREAYAQVMQEQGADAGHEDHRKSEKQPLETTAPERKSRKRQKTPDQLDAEDNEHCSISPKSIVESILFVGTPAGSTLTARKLAAVMRDVSPKEVKQVIKELNQDYEKDNAPFRIIEESGNYCVQLQPDLIDLQNHYFGRNRPARLSQSAIDVLAIVAYNQPVTRRQVDKIRLKPSGNVLNQLLRRELISVQQVDGSKDSHFQTTDRFLELFGLESSSDLPQTSAGSDMQELADF